MIRALHSWDVSPKQAVQLQKELRRRVRTDLPLESPQRIAGVDVGYLPSSRQSIATVVVLSYPGLDVLEQSVSRLETPFPYVPGLLSFRELPAIVPAFEGLKRLPDLILVDGHGAAHPRRFGIASHLGLLLEIPSIGIGKKRLCGEFREPGLEKGERAELEHKGERIGIVLRTRHGVKPVFVSVGYGLPLEQCVDWTLKCTPRYRLPEPIRQAHNLAARRKAE